MRFDGVMECVVAYLLWAYVVWCMACVCIMVYVHVAFAWRMVYVAWCMLLVYVVWVQNRSIPGTGSVFGNEIPVITNIIQYLTLFTATETNQHMLLNISLGFVSTVL